MTGKDDVGSERVMERLGLNVKVTLLGMEFKTVGCPVTGVLTYLELVRGKYDKYKQELQFAKELCTQPPVLYD